LKYFKVASNLKRRLLKIYHGKKLARGIYIISICINRFIYIGSIAILVILFTSLAVADDLVKKQPAEDPVSKGLTHLLDIVDQNNKTLFNPSLVAPVLDFVASTKKPPVKLDIDTTNKATGAYGEFFIKKKLKHILQLVYHPSIPSFLFSPTTTRMGYWKEVEGKRKSLPALWKLTATTKRPVVINGVEHEITTPDINSGAYYQYDQDRTLIFYRYKKSNIFISLTKQNGTSHVGQKGLVLGSDEEWNYFYSGVKGLTKMPVPGGGVKVPGLNKIESYMYDSYSIVVYYELDPAKPLVKCGVFKWVNAGWKNVNMVREKHVYNGIMRYAKSFKTVIENPHLPSSAVIASALLRLERYDINSLRKKVRLYFKHLEEKCKSKGLEPGEMFVSLVNSDAYIKEMSKKEMQSILALEYMKGILQKEQVLNVNKKSAPGSL